MLSCDPELWRLLAAQNWPLDPVILAIANIVVARDLSREFVAHRLTAMREQRIQKRPPPYDEPSLDGLSPDDEFLVAAHDVQGDGSMRIGDVIRQAALTTHSPNSMYWTMGSSPGSHVSERFDSTRLLSAPLPSTPRSPT